VGAAAKLTLGGVPLCSPFQVEDFAVTATDPDVCIPNIGPTANDPELPGQVAFLLKTAGTCAVDLRLPAANAGQGLSQKLSVTFTSTPP
jgi:hypothetical protein